jgi:hypothetical protein
VQISHAEANLFPVIFSWLALALFLIPGPAVFRGNQPGTTPVHALYRLLLACEMKNVNTRRGCREKVGNSEYYFTAAVIP